MKKNLTVRIDSEVLHKARLRAQTEGIFLSGALEQALRSFVEEGESGDSFASKWVGRLSVPEPNPSDPRLEYILKKYARARDRG